MTPEQVGAVLAVASAYDGRDIGDGDVIAWHALLADIEFEMARAAVFEHYDSEVRRIMPADIKAYVRRQRPGVHDRTVRELGLYEPPTPPNAEYLAARQRMREGRATS